MEPKEILKKARMSKGYTQEAIADKVGLSHRMYQRYEEGKFPKYKSDQIKKIDQLLGTSLNTILYGKASTGKHDAANEEVIQLKDKDAGKVIGDMQERILALEAKTTILLVTITEILSHQTKKRAAHVSVELSKAIDLEIDRLLAELRKKS